MNPQPSSAPVVRRERVVVVCPGRGTYNQAEWGYLARHHAARAALVESFDALRRAHQQPTLTELDGRLPYQLALHSRGDHASALIWACAHLDALALDPRRYEVVAVTGNSMGWYIALGVGGALPALDALNLVNTMGTLMQTALAGGQLLYPWVDEAWRPQPREKERLLALAAQIGAAGDARLYLSIDLGGMLVFGGDETGLKRMQAALPAQGRFPMRLHNHAAFHTPLQQPVREQARRLLPATPFAAPRVPLVDGFGRIWTPHATDPQALWDYTLGAQLTEPYDFTRAVSVALREFAPDRLVLLGPGGTLGGAVAQIMIQNRWRGLDCKDAFQAAQAADPFLLSMGIDEQRATAVATAPG
ncbi:MAG: ACP S-malonyltransferase [Gammaproteobacteria bacterium]|nr:ACP S-malonyltransferase [Gammaproteobacteria bacterium]